MGKGPNRARAWARALAEDITQKMTLEEKVSQMLHKAPAIPRLDIPAYNWWGEALHGVARAGTATVFPQAIGLAAAFDREMLHEVAAVTATEGRAKYHAQFQRGDHDIYKGLTFWSPNVNIFRDPRWGRGHETYGEDPYLSGQLGVAFIEGLQGDDPKYLKAAACAKHLAVHSGPEDLRHSFNAEIDKKSMYETYLPAFEACVKEGHVEAVMGAYNRVNGEAACASKVLLEDILRDEWGFKGHVVSDCWAIKDIYTTHGICDTPEEAAALAIIHGCDVNCGVVFEYAKKAVDKGLLKESAITEAVTRLFTTRYLLGIMPGQETPFDDTDYLETDSPEHRQLNREVARKVPVLLKNDGVLPFALSGQTIGVIGPNANNRRALMGNYEGTASRYVTILEGIQDYAEAKGSRVLFSEGCHLWKDRLSNLSEPNDRLAEAKAVADASDVIVAVMGLDSSLEGEQGDTSNQFDSGDKANLAFPGLQHELMDVLYATGKPVVLIVLSGSCLALDTASEHAAAILQAWYPGAQGGHAVADILFGAVSPEGKLPLTFYSEHYQMPSFTDYRMDGRTYRFTQDDILYPFGFGLTYTTMNLSDAKVEGAIEPGSKLTLTATVTNTGKQTGAETVQVYVDAPALGTPFPQLKAFTKIHLASGASAPVSLEIPVDTLRTYNEDGRAILTEGTYTFHIGFHQPDPRSQALTGHTPCTCTLTK